MQGYLTFDIGTTALKTALVTDEGSIEAVHRSDYAYCSPRPTWAEMAPDTYWRAAVEGSRAVIAASGAEVLGIGFSSQGQTFVALDRAGRPLHDAIVWLDQRAAELASGWRESWLPDDKYRGISGYPRVPAELTVFKIAWLAANAPNAHAAELFLCIPDYLIYRLTGEVATDHTTALMTGLFDLQAQDYRDELLHAAGIGREQLPRVHRSGTAVGALRREAAAELGLPAGVPVCLGANDQLAGAVGAGNVRPHCSSETTGAALALVATTDSLIDDNRLAVGWHAAYPACYAMAYSNTSAVVLRWLRDLCAPGEPYETLVAEAARVPPGCDGLSVLPHFSGTGTPTCNPDARGAIVGLTLAHGRGHLARAVMEACACLLRECAEPLAERGAAPCTVRSLGGAARSDLWLQMKADMLGLPIERPKCSEAASLGAAMLAAAGTGHSASIEEAADAWYRRARLFEPDPAKRGVYDEVYARYQDLCSRLYGDPHDTSTVSGTVASSS